MDATEWVFGDCVLRPGPQELLIAGERRHLPPRAFALLLHLARHLDQVVPKNDLIQAVWGQADVSDNVLARTVMTVRRALGDDGEDRTRPPRLRTVHRVGYRLVGGPAPAPWPERRPGSRLRLALLPLVHDTPEEPAPLRGWGLPALCLAPLADDERLTVLASETVRHALGLLGGGPPAPSAAERLQALLGADAVVHSRLSREGSASRLDFTLRLGSAEHAGSLREDDATLLPLRLVQALEPLLFPGEPRRHAQAVPADPLVRQALSRAAEVAGQEHWDQAARLLRVVLDICPDDLGTRIEYLRTLANLVDPEALSVGEQALAQARERGDPRWLAAAHEGLGRAILNLEGDQALERSQAHLDAALALARPFEDEDWVCRIYLGQAIGAELARDYARADTFYRLAERANRPAGNRLREAVILSNQAVLACHGGELLRARELALAALALCETHGLLANEVDVLSGLALTEAGLGLWDSARSRCERALARAPGLPRNEHGSAAWVVLVAALCTMDGGWPPVWCEQVAAALGPLDREGQPRVALALQLAEALRAELRGDAEAADIGLAAALASLQAAGYREMEHLVLRWSVGVARHRGSPARALGLTPVARALPAAPEDGELQTLLRHAEAAQALADGERATARDTLLQALTAAPLGGAQQLLRADLAWLALEDGHPADARRWLQGAAAWCDSHPLGRLLDWRLTRAGQPGADDAWADLLCPPAAGLPAWLGPAPGGWPARAPTLLSWSPRRPP